MFKKIIDLTYQEVKSQHPELIHVCNDVRRIIVFKNSAIVDCCEESSDVMAFYEIVHDGKPLLFVERIMGSKGVRFIRRKVLQHIDKELTKDYVVNVERNPDNKKIIDVILTRKDVYNRICDLEADEE